MAFSSAPRSLQYIHHIHLVQRGQNRGITVLGMVVWQNTDGVFLGQGKYAVEILKRLRMMDYMTTPMASKLKLLSVASS